MLGGAPPAIRWEGQAAEFLDKLVEVDIAYLDAQESVERLIHAGLLDELAIAFEVDNRTVYMHCFPKPSPRLIPLYVFTTRSQSGMIHVLHICFAQT